MGIELYLYKSGGEQEVFHYLLKKSLDEQRKVRCWQLEDEGRILSFLAETLRSQDCSFALLFSLFFHQRVRFCSAFLASVFPAPCPRQRSLEQQPMSAGRGYVKMLREKSSGECNEGPNSASTERPNSEPSTSGRERRECELVELDHEALLSKYNNVLVEAHILDEVGVCIKCGGF